MKLLLFGYFFIFVNLLLIGFSGILEKRNFSFYFLKELYIIFLGRKNKKNNLNKQKINLENNNK